MTHLCWVDHYPHPGSFLSFLNENYRDQLKKNPIKVMIHLFGDFILHSPQWFHSVGQWQNKDLSIQLVTASHKQAELVNQFLIDSHCEVIPFPVNSQEFSFCSQLREKRREQLGASSQEHLFFYSGRLSYQKNIFDVINGFQHFLKMTGSQARLLIAGPMDDLGIPYIGKEALDSTFYFHWEECMLSLPENVRKKVQYVGNLGAQELREYYCAVDTYVSMSCHNDEDFGMAPAEALMCGLPCILSEWGGFPSFKSYAPQWVQTVPINLSKKRQAPEVLRVAKSMIAAQKVSSREEVQRVVRSSLENSEVGKKLKETLSQARFDFSGFNAKFSKLSSLFESHHKGPFRSGEGSYSLFYQEIYQVYCGAVGGKS